MHGHHYHHAAPSPILFDSYNCTSDALFPISARYKTPAPRVKTAAELKAEAEARKRRRAQRKAERVAEAKRIAHEEKL